jgi:phage host-nuclease inhibitor protein Gam
MAKKLKGKKIICAMPADEAEAAKLLARLGELKRQLQIVAVETEAAMKAATERALILVEPVKAEAAAVSKALQAWADKNRGSLVDAESKTIKLPTGQIYWRLGSEALVIAEGFDEESLIAELRRRRLGDLVRVSEALDKDAIKQAWDRIAHVPGLQRVQREFFYLAPLSVAEPIELKTKTVEVVATSGATETADA